MSVEMRAAIPHERGVTEPGDSTAMTGGTQVVDQRRPAPRPDDSLLLQSIDRPRRPPMWLVRAFDIVVSATLLLLALPVLAGAALAVRRADGAPVLFGQERVGRYGRPIRVLKFRTMVRDADARLAELLATDPGAAEEFRLARKLQHDPRLHRYGHLMRRLKVDELPQLWNVLRGDMSIVGPRPVLADEVVRYGPFGQIVFALRPGLTGPWQVLATDVEDYDERIELDVSFAQSHSFYEVLMLAARTPVAIASSLKKKEFV